MQLGRVRGTVVATRKDENLIGLRFLLVEELDARLAGTGRFVVAADAVGAGSGEVVLYASGSSARLTEITRDRPVDAVISAIVDTVDADGEIVYSKSGSSSTGPRTDASRSSSSSGGGK
jgi:microcompartment protein CcmK/EutM